MVNHRTWKLIVSEPKTGPENMALDEALLQDFISNPIRPVFRVYFWKPACITLGRFQNAMNDLDISACQADHQPFVRRMTGGGIIYHDNEITYSLACSSESIGENLSVKESFKKLCRFILLFYQKLGLSANYAADTPQTGETLGARTAFCFAGKEESDILIGGKKIGGNAQRRFKQTVFQHGSIPLHFSSEKALKYLRNRPAGIELKTIGLSDAGIQAERAFLVEKLVESFSENLSVTFERLEPSLEISRKASEWLNNKYLNPSWNREGIEIHP